jgi:hypothetical protein
MSLYVGADFEWFTIGYLFALFIQRMRLRGKQRKRREVRKGPMFFSEAAKLIFLRAKLTVHTGKIQ